MCLMQFAFDVQTKQSAFVALSPWRISCLALVEDPTMAGRFLRALPRVLVAEGNGGFVGFHVPKRKVEPNCFVSKRDT